MTPLLFQEATASSQLTLIVISAIGFFSLIITAVVAPLLITRSNNNIVKQNREWDRADRAERDKKLLDATTEVKIAAETASTAATASQETTREIKSETEQIHRQVNSNLAEVKEKFEAFRRESDQRDRELHALILSLAERSTTMIGVPLGARDQERLSNLGSPKPREETAVKEQVVEGLTEALKDIKVNTIITDTINVKKGDVPEP